MTCVQSKSAPIPTNTTSPTIPCTPSPTAGVTTACSSVSNVTNTPTQPTSWGTSTSTSSRCLVWMTPSRVGSTDRRKIFSD
nr:unnamed protein product [Callosobruchus chinensis]